MRSGEVFLDGCCSCLSFREVHVASIIKIYGLRETPLLQHSSHKSQPPALTRLEITLGKALSEIISPEPDITFFGIVVEGSVFWDNLFEGDSYSPTSALKAYKTSRWSTTSHPRRLILRPTFMSAKTNLRVGTRDIFRAVDNSRG